MNRFVCLMVALFGFVGSVQGQVVPRLVQDERKFDHPSLERMVLQQEYRASLRELNLSKALEMIDQRDKMLFHVQEQLDQVMENQVKLSRQISSVGKQVGEVGRKVEGVGEQVGEVGRKVEGVGEQVGEVGRKVEGVGEQVGEVGRKVDALKPTTVINNWQICTPKKRPRICK